MKEYDFIQMICRIKKLPDELLLRVLKAICYELDDRTKKIRRTPPDKWQKG